jgi:sarcosine oxidase subunit beta
MIAIIGGGIIGTSIAYYLSKAGIKDIVLIEKEDLLGMGVTQYCSGGVRSQFTTPINVKFSTESFKELGDFDIDYKKLGYLVLDMKNDSMPRVKMQNALGVESEYLKPGEIKRRFPYINVEGVVSGTFYGRDGIADPGKLLSIYEKGAKERGVKFLFGTKVNKILKDGKGVVGIQTDKEELKTDMVILAAGVGSPELGATVNMVIPIVHIRKYVLVVDGFDFDFPLTMEIPTGWYIKKEGDECLMGMSGKDEKVDFERQEESMEETVEASLNRFPKTEECGMKKVLSSMSDETPDKHAIIDNSTPGLIIATGFSGHGFMHSPATGKIVASLVKGEKPVLDVSELRLGRKAIKETVAI